MKKTLFFYIIFLFVSSFMAAAGSSAAKTSAASPSEQAKQSKKAEQKDYLSMRITPEVGLLNGFVKEYVFNNACKNKDNVESRLDWDVKNIVLFKIRGDFDILDYIFTGLDFSIAVPGKSGQLQDYDWLNSLGGLYGTNTSLLNDAPDEVTNYSCHSNRIDKYMSFSFALGGNIFLPYEIKVSPFVSYDYDYIGFSAFDGWGIYKESNWNQTDFSGKMFSYKQESNAFSGGFKIQTGIVPRTWLYSDFSVSPALTFTNAMDYHFNSDNKETGAAYWDKFTFLWQLKANLKAQFIFNENHSAGFAGFIQYVPRQKGTTYTKELANGRPVKGNWMALPVNGGLERFIWSVSLSYSFSL